MSASSHIRSRHSITIITIILCCCCFFFIFVLPTTTSSSSTTKTNSFFFCEAKTIPVPAPPPTASLQRAFYHFPADFLNVSSLPGKGDTYVLEDFFNVEQLVIGEVSNNDVEIRGSNNAVFFFDNADVDLADPLTEPPSSSSSSSKRTAPKFPMRENRNAHCRIGRINMTTSLSNSKITLSRCQVGAFLIDELEHVEFSNVQVNFSQNMFSHTNGRGGGGGRKNGGGGGASSEADEEDPMHALMTGANNNNITLRAGSSISFRAKFKWHSASAGSGATTPSSEFLILDNYFERNDARGEDPFGSFERTVVVDLAEDRFPPVNITKRTYHDWPYWYDLNILQIEGNYLNYRANCFKCRLFSADGSVEGGQFLLRSFSYNTLFVASTFCARGFNYQFQGADGTRWLASHGGSTLRIDGNNITLLEYPFNATETAATAAENNINNRVWPPPHGGLSTYGIAVFTRGGYWAHTWKNLKLMSMSGNNVHIYMPNRGAQGFGVFFQLDELIDDTLSNLGELRMDRNNVFVGALNQTICLNLNLFTVVSHIGRISLEHNNLTSYMIHPIVGSPDPTVAQKAVGDVRSKSNMGIDFNWYAIANVGVMSLSHNNIQQTGNGATKVRSILCSAIEAVKSWYWTSHVGNNWSKPYWNVIGLRNVSLVQMRNNSLMVSRARQEIYGILASQVWSFNISKLWIEGNKVQLHFEHDFVTQGLGKGVQLSGLRLLMYGADLHHVAIENNIFNTSGSTTDMFGLARSSTAMNALFLAVSRSPFADTTILSDENPFGKHYYVDAMLNTGDFTIRNNSMILKELSSSSFSGRTSCISFLSRYAIQNWAKFVVENNTCTMQDIAQCSVLGNCGMIAMVSGSDRFRNFSLINISNNVFNFRNVSKASKQYSFSILQLMGAVLIPTDLIPIFDIFTFKLEVLSSKNYQLDIDTVILANNIITSDSAFLAGFCILDTVIMGNLTIRNELVLSNNVISGVAAAAAADEQNQQNQQQPSSSSSSSSSSTAPPPVNIGPSKKSALLHLTNPFTYIHFNPYIMNQSGLPVPPHLASMNQEIKADFYGNQSHVFIRRVVIDRTRLRSNGGVAVPMVYALNAVPANFKSNFRVSFGGASSSSGGDGGGDVDETFHLQDENVVGGAPSAAADDVENNNNNNNNNNADDRLLFSFLTSPTETMQKNSAEEGSSILSQAASCQSLLGRRHNFSGIFTANNELEFFSSSSPSSSANTADSFLSTIISLVQANSSVNGTLCMYNDTILFSPTTTLPSSSAATTTTTSNSGFIFYQVSPPAAASSSSPSTTSTPTTTTSVRPKWLFFDRLKLSVSCSPSSARCDFSDASSSSSPASQQHTHITSSDTAISVVSQSSPTNNKKPLFVSWFALPQIVRLTDSNIRIARASLSTPISLFAFPWLVPFTQEKNFQKHQQQHQQQISSAIYGTTLSSRQQKLSQQQIQQGFANPVLIILNSNLSSSSPSFQSPWDAETHYSNLKNKKKNSDADLLLVEAPALCNITIASAKLNITGGNTRTASPLFSPQNSNIKMVDVVTLFVAPKDGDRMKIQRTLNFTDVDVFTNVKTQTDFHLVGGGTSSSSFFVEDGGEASSTQRAWSKSVDGNLYCFNFNKYPIRKASPILTPMRYVESPFYVPCPASPTMSLSETISIVPLCGSFLLQYIGPALSGATVVRQNEVTIFLAIIPASARDTPAPLAAGGRIVPPNMYPPLGEQQQEDFSVFRDSVPNITGDDAAYSPRYEDPFSKWEVRYLPVMLRSGNHDIASVVSGSVRNKRSLALTLKFNGEKLDRDATHQLQILVDPALMACRTVGSSSSGGGGGGDEDRQQQQQRPRGAATSATTKIIDGFPPRDRTSGWFVAELTIHRRKSYLPEALVKATEYSSAVAAVVTAPLSGPIVGVGMARLAAMTSLAECDFAMDAPLTFLDNPLGWGFGDARGHYLRGAIFGNLFILVLLVVMLAMTAYVRWYASKRRREQWILQYKIRRQKERRKKQQQQRRRRSRSSNLLHPEFERNQEDGNIRSDYHDDDVVEEAGDSDDDNDAKDEKQYIKHNAPEVLSIINALYLAKLPCSLVVPASILMIGSVSSSVSLILAGTGPLDRVLGFVCIAAHLYMCIWMVHVSVVQLPKHTWVTFKYFDYAKEDERDRFSKRFFLETADDDEGGDDGLDPATREMFASCRSCTSKSVKKRLDREERKKQQKKRDRLEQKQQEKEEEEERHRLRHRQQQHGDDDDSYYHHHHNNNNSEAAATTSLLAPASASFATTSTTAPHDENKERHREVCRRRDACGLMSVMFLKWMRPYGEWTFERPKDWKKQQSISQNFDYCCENNKNRDDGGVRNQQKMRDAVSVVSSISRSRSDNTTTNKNNRRNENPSVFFLPRTIEVFAQCKDGISRHYMVFEVFVSFFIAVITGTQAVLETCEWPMLLLTLLNVIPFAGLFALWPYSDFMSNFFSLATTSVLITMGVTQTLGDVFAHLNVAVFTAILESLLSFVGVFRSAFDLVVLSLTFQTWLIIPFFFGWHLLFHENGPLSAVAIWANEKWEYLQKKYGNNINNNADGSHRRPSHQGSFTALHFSRGSREEAGVVDGDDDDDDDAALNDDIDYFSFADDHDGGEEMSAAATGSLMMTEQQRALRKMQGGRRSTHAASKCWDPATAVESRSSSSMGGAGGRLLFSDYSNSRSAAAAAAVSSSHVPPAAVGVSSSSRNNLSSLPSETAAAPPLTHQTVRVRSAAAPLPSATGAGAGALRSSTGNQTRSSSTSAVAIDVDAPDYHRSVSEFPPYHHHA